MLKKIAYIMGGIAIVFFAVGLLLPAEIRVQRSTEIAASPEQIFPYINNFHKFNEWQPWVEKDKSAIYNYIGPESGKGAKITWTSERMGTGSQEIIASEPNKKVQTRLEFGEEGDISATFTLTPVQDKTRVSWEFYQPLGFDIPARYIGLLINGWIGGDYEQGLANLKSLLENPVRSE